MKTDHIFHVLFRIAPEIVLELIGQQPTVPYKFSSVEVKETAFRFDGVLVPKIESASQPTVFVEVQFQKDIQFYRRLFAEIFVFLSHNPNVIHWRAIVIFARRSREPAEQQRLPYQSLLNSDQVHRIYLEDFQELSTDSLNATILQLIVTKPKAAIQRAKSLIERVKVNNDSSLSDSQILGLIETIVVYKFPVLEREVIAKMLGIDVLKETRVYQDALQEGRQEGQSELILKLLTRRLGELSEQITNSIQALSGKQLDKLSDRFFEIETIDELKSCLTSLTSDKTETNQPPIQPGDPSNN
ncbi:MAG: Rpn family recombination-promoting nuclease/putative transposase [Phormidesmis sp.]